ncbi:MAG TPA: MerR family transcriptional regulator [Gaiellaceae bacterium]|nr:MerR family transcriptional regulator [Gaiellaceae bacterium]
MSAPAVLRIGELSRRSGVSPELLRAWERRYGLLEPGRSAGGLRLYTEADLARVRAMQHHLAAGLAAAEAARLATSSPADAAEPALAPRSARAELEAAFAAMDEPAAHAVLDTLLAGTTLDNALREVVIPYLHELGERWARGEASVAEEHFASGVLRGRLLGLARDWARGLGRPCLLACAPGEQHDLGLIVFGLALRARGWRIGYLGADMPVDSVTSAAAALAPAFVVISSVSAERFEASATGLRELAATQSLCLGGTGAWHATLDFDAIRLTGDPVEEAERLTQLASDRN